MLKDRRNAAQKIADQLMASERSIDLALADVAGLTGAMPAARIEANIAAEVGQEALEQAAEVLVALVSARRKIIATHRELAGVKDRIGLREVALGGLVPKEAADAGGLRVVAQAA
ncbi:hypothetical protein [Edaphosphingomonas haloaromaticamans]|uniref:Uncharacterized protein n=1 Tax=Edaphosphingomonas haloaromaticamans TaxID=653954 RepID=A0A1S1HA84_9SPHN|nr:hypothetical protein [Sphingomonas haloaromaticamans]OHT19119.1 hypothetical protein BHE75_01102 [Sphingomonas haloaromaticamans]